MTKIVEFHCLSLRHARTQSSSFVLAWSIPGGISFRSSSRLSTVASCASLAMLIGHQARASGIPWVSSKSNGPQGNRNAGLASPSGSSGTSSYARETRSRPGAPNPWHNVTSTAGSLPRGAIKIDSNPPQTLRSKTQVSASNLIGRIT